MITLRSETDAALGPLENVPQQGRVLGEDGLVTRDLSVDQSVVSIHSRVLILPIRGQYYLGVPDPELEVGVMEAGEGPGGLARLEVTAQVNSRHWHDDKREKSNTENLKYRQYIKIVLENLDTS